MRSASGFKYPVEVRVLRHSLVGWPAARILYLSDLHFTGRSAPRAEELLQRTAQLKPDLVLLGGDYADSPAGLRLFAAWTGRLAMQAPVLAIAGNHDKLFGLRRIARLVESAGAQWIEGASVYQTIGGLRLRTDGNCIVEGTEPAMLCLHKPVHPKRFAAHYRLACAGHLHGGQCVLWRRGEDLFPGRLLYRWNRLSWQDGHCSYYISKGLGDTLPLRYNCLHDLLLFSINENDAALLP